MGSFQITYKLVDILITHSKIPLVFSRETRLKTFFFASFNKDFSPIDFFYNIFYAHFVSDEAMFDWVYFHIFYTLYFSFDFAFFTIMNDESLYFRCKIGTFPLYLVHEC